MSVYEVELRQQVEAKFGLLANRMALVIFEQYHQLLNYLYTFLKGSYLHIPLIQSNNSIAYLKSSEDNQIKLRLNERQLSILNELQHQRVKIGKVGEYDIYFDLNSSNIFSFNFGKTVLSDPLESDAAVYPRYQEAFAIIEGFGSIHEAVVHKQTGDITLFLKDGSEKIISSQHPFFSEISAIFSGELVEVGKVVVDELMFSSQIGFFNGQTGKPIENLDEVSAVLHPLTGEAIRLSKDRYVTLSNKTDSQNQPVTIILDGTEVTYLPDNPLHALLQQLQCDVPIVVGRCESRFKVFFSRSSGPIIKTDFRSHYGVYQELDRLHGVKGKIKPYSHIFFDPNKPGSLAIISPGERLQKIKYLRSSDPMFALYLKLVQGQVGVITESDNSDSLAYTVVYHTEQGLIFDKQPMINVKAAIESLHATFFYIDPEELTEPHFSEKRFSKGQMKKYGKREEAAKKSKNKRTSKEKRKTERKKLPNK